MGTSSQLFPETSKHVRTPQASATRVGLIAGAATAGVLIGLGLRHGTALQPFAATGRIMLSAVAGRLPETVLAFAGAVIHFAVATFLAWCAVKLVKHVGGRALIGAVAVALVAWVASTWLFPTGLRALTADLSFGQQLVYYSVLGITLWGGIRLASDEE